MHDFLEDLSVHEDEKNTTSSILRGIAKAFRDRGTQLGGWEANLMTDVAVGSGLSSSASVEVLVAEIFNTLCNNGEYGSLELARIGQYAENVYFGKPSGLLDQICCATGGIVGIDFKDRDNPVVTPLIWTSRSSGSRWSSRIRTAAMPILLTSMPRFLRR